MPILDSGKRQEFDTGSVRDTEDGKGDFSLLPYDGLRELAIHFQEGAKKYSRNNWRKGQPLSRFMSSAARHLFQVLAGDTDEPHGRSAGWNLVCFLDTAVRIERGELPAELDDIGYTERGRKFLAECDKADAILDEKNKAGLPDDVLLEPSVPEGFEWTGEYREPVKWEWFLATDGQIYRSPPGSGVECECGNKYILRETTRAPAI